MPWTCRLIENRDVVKDIGDMYFSEHYTRDHAGEFDRILSPEYKRDWYGKRPPIFVMTPAGLWCIDAVSYPDGVPSNSGWTITGDVPNLTAAPSINFKGSYHGWLQNGILSDDVEGRVYK